ncbi:MAG: hypothetical protein GEV11_19005 [Streptosporangiales bacterium]|nr:hypothetical protein [Streptosporangiales bacterium]
MRAAIAELPDGTHTAALETDGFGEETLLLNATLSITGEDIHIDFAGSSPQSRYGVNVVLNYTRAYASFAVKAAIAPEVPHNAGSFRPVHVTAPRGSVLNCEPPAPVASRHLVGHFLPSLLFTALRPALPGRLLAQSADALWMTVWRGRQPETGATAEEDPYTLTVFQAGGAGARATKDGLNTTGFPTGVRAAPTEVVETLTPLVQRRRELRTDSGGPGRQRGGLGQVTEVECRVAGPWTVNGNVDRTLFPAAGAEGGGPGAAGSFTTAEGAELPRKSLVLLDAGDAVLLRLPGGGGYGDPFTRDPARVRADVADGYVSIEAARRDYGVAITYTGPPDALVRPPASYTIDERETARLRGPGRVPGD